MLRRLSLIILLISLLVLLSTSLASAELLNWEQVVGDGFGDGNNAAINCLAVFGNYFYAGTLHSLGAEVWRTSDGTSWEQVVGDGAGGGNGFGDANNNQIMSMADFENYLYAGTYNATGGGEIWRSSDGTTWEPVVGPPPATVTNGFGDANNVGIYAMAVLESYLYAGTGSSLGTEVWRTSDGTTWQKVVGNGAGIGDGFGDGNNTTVFSMTVFADYLYAGTYNPTGTEIWRTSDGTTWQEVVGDGAGGGNGFGDTNNRTTETVLVFGNYLYVGLWNSTTGTEVWRTSDGTTWEQVNQNGFGDANNQSTYSMAVFGNYLYAGTQNPNNGTEVWRTSDGTTWEQVNQNGFGDANNQSTYSMAVFGSYLYAGTYSPTFGTAQIWRVQEVTPAQDLPATGGEVAGKPASPNILLIGLLGLAGLLASALGLTLLRRTSKRVRG